jgi:hypothetical protein
MVELHRNRPNEQVGQYSFSLLAAITQDKVLSMQLLEGGTDAVLFENFLYRTLNKLRLNT